MTTNQDVQNMLPYALRIVQANGPSSAAYDSSIVGQAFALANGKLRTNLWCCCNPEGEQVYFATETAHGWMCNRCRGTTQML